MTAEKQEIWVNGRPTAIPSSHLSGGFDETAGTICDDRKLIDPKELGIPNICFSLVDDDHPDAEEFRQQRMLRGFDDSETWSLTDTIANFIIPRLERYLEIIKDVVVADKEGEEDLLEVIKALKLLTKDEGVRLYGEDTAERIEKAMHKFADLFTNLWW